MITAPSSANQSPPLLLQSDKRDRSYVPSYDWGAGSLGDRHDRIADGVWSIPGWLAPEDCRKLYELAYFAEGPISRSAPTAGARPW